MNISALHVSPFADGGVRLQFDRDGKKRHHFELTHDQARELLQGIAAQIGVTITEPDAAVLLPMPGAVELTASDYLDSRRFPLTSQRLELASQLRIDAFNLDALRQAIEDGDVLDESQRAHLAELEAKEPNMKKLAALAWQANR
jgi:hypothetical protein